MQPCPKPEPRSKAKARAKRHEADVIARVRTEVAATDGRCRLEGVGMLCDGPSEWAHAEDYRRSRTRGRLPEARHAPQGSLMLCHRHHDYYDQHKIRIVTLDPTQGMRGMLAIRFSTGLGCYVETVDGFVFLLDEAVRRLADFAEGASKHDHREEEATRDCAR